MHTIFCLSYGYVDCAQSIVLTSFLLLYAANIHGTGVRKYPDPIGWVAAMPVEDRADVGSFWSGYTKEGPDLKRPRQLGNQAGKLISLIERFTFVQLLCSEHYSSEQNSVTLFLIRFHGNEKSNSIFSPHCLSWWIFTTI